MQVGAKYSHLNGEEYLLLHKPALWAEVQEVIAGIDAEAYKTKVSKEKTMPGRLLYAPTAMNAAFKRGFKDLHWRGRQNTFWVTRDERLLRGIYGMTAKEQKAAIQDAGHEPIRSYNQTDFLKDRVAVEVQFGKYAFVAHDLFVKHLSFYASDIIDVAIEIVPMKELEEEMSSGVPYYERDLLNVLRQGRGVPAVPFVLVGVKP